MLCVLVRDRGREECVCTYVCLRERSSERDEKGERGKGRKRDAESESVCLSV